MAFVVVFSMGHMTPMRTHGPRLPHDDARASSPHAVWDTGHWGVDIGVRDIAVAIWDNGQRP